MLGDHTHRLDETIEYSAQTSGVFTECQQMPSPGEFSPGLSGLPGYHQVPEEELCQTESESLRNILCAVILDSEVVESSEINLLVDGLVCQSNDYNLNSYLSYLLHCNLV